MWGGIGSSPRAGWLSNVNSLAVSPIAPAVLPFWRDAPGRYHVPFVLIEIFPADLPSPLGKYSESLSEPRGWDRFRTYRQSAIRGAAVDSRPKDIL
jgi:hypothetical protein